MSLTNKGDEYHPLYEDDMIDQLGYVKDRDIASKPIMDNYPLNIRDLKRIDFIDLTVYLTKDKYNMLKTWIDNYMVDYQDNLPISDVYFFEDFVIREYIDDNSGDIRYWYYHIEDDKYLILESYTWVEKAGMLLFDAGIRVLLSNYTFVWIILTHLQDENHDNRKTFNRESFYLLSRLGVFFKYNDIYNIYSYQDSNNDEDFYDGYDVRVFYPASEFGNLYNKDKIHLVDIFAAGIGRFAAVNNYLLRSVEDNIEIRYRYTDDNQDYIHSTVVNSFIDEVVGPTEDKPVIMDIGKIRANISNPDNIFTIRNFSKRVYEYKMQVRGHKQHYWVGSGVNRHREVRWKNPYYKNKDKPFKIIREVQDSSEE